MAHKEIKTPSFDALPPQRQRFVYEYVKRFNPKEAAIAAEYAEGGADKRAKELLRLPEVTKAVHELIDLVYKDAGQRKIAIINRLFAESVVSLEDLTEWDEKKDKLVIRKPSEVEELYRGCLGMVTLSREGKAVFAQGQAIAARKLLAEYMLWTKETPDTAPAVSFSFSGIKQVEYIKPD